MVERSPYAVLGVRPDAGDAEIHDAYRKLAKRHHPDLHGDDPLAETRFKEIAAAFDVLSHKEKRARLDRSATEAAATTAEPFFSQSTGHSRQRRGGSASDGKSTAKPRFGFGTGAVICLLLAVLAIIFAWAGADDRMARWGSIEIPSSAIFFLFMAAALLVIRTIGSVLSPDDEDDP